MTRDQQINFRASAEERAAYDSAAARAGLAPAAWMRAVLGVASGDEALKVALRGAEREAKRLAKSGDDCG